MDGEDCPTARLPCFPCMDGEDCPTALHPRLRSPALSVTPLNYSTPPDGPLNYSTPPDGPRLCL